MFARIGLIKDYEIGEAFDWELQSRLNGVILDFNEKHYMNNFVS